MPAEATVAYVLVSKYADHLLIETCKLNVIDPLACRIDTLTAIVNGHEQSQIDEVLPWNYPAKV